MNDHLRSRSQLGFQVDRSAQFLESGLDHVHTHSPPGQAGNLVDRGKARMENQLGRLVLTHGLGLGLGNQVIGDGLGLDLARVDALSVVLHRDDYLSAIVPTLSFP